MLDSVVGYRQMLSAKEDQQQFKGICHVVGTSAIFRGCARKSQSCDPSLTIGVGAGALYMLLNCHEEMNSLGKTLSETENLVQVLKQQLRHHQEERSHGEQSAENSPPGRDLYKKISSTSQPNVPLINCNIKESSGGQSPAMDKDQIANLAAELEAELELMGLNMKPDESFSFKSFVHDACEVHSSRMSNPYYSDASSHGMPGTCERGRRSSHSESMMDHAVIAIELDCRLREVLEAQQQERISELEQLLQATKSKLRAKEHEISYWKEQVNSLANFLRHSSRCETQTMRLNRSNGVSGSLGKHHETAVPEVTKRTIDPSNSSQGSAICKQAGEVRITRTSHLMAETDNQEDGTQLFNSAITPPSSLSNTRSPANTMEKSRVAAIKTGKFVAIKESGGRREIRCESFEKRTPCKISEVCNSVTPDIINKNSQSTLGHLDASKDAERPRSIETESVMSRNLRSTIGHPGASKDVNYPCLLETKPAFPEFHHRKCKSNMNAVYMDENNINESRNLLKLSQVHKEKSRFDADEASLSPNVLRNREGKQHVDVKPLRGPTMPKETSYDDGTKISSEDATKELEMELKASKRDVHLLTERPNIVSGRRMDVESHVWEKIKHFEALGRRINGR
ncbi:hypothetical protein KP509_30G063600 [Ceratopteris richardii]|uniref:Uncharacterized protein n=3 Tax=Ceratopteris richardii TaxID=49495 RepID=A0A8T2R3A0_CERRI|nr:hypothetical protein KP509_30G063600 [Ceratopteris richardii]